MVKRSIRKLIKNLFNTPFSFCRERVFDFTLILKAVKVLSKQSVIFKWITKRFSERLDAISTVDKLRRFSGEAQKKMVFPRGINGRTMSVEGVPVEWITPEVTFSQAVILYFHGGGWTLGWYNNHRNLVAHICQAASSRALAIDYRLAPENPFPAALEDCLAVYRWLLKNGTAPEEIVLAGDSAGGNLVLTTLMSLRDAGEPLPAGGICISPMTDLTCSGDSFYSGKDVLLTAKFASMCAGYYAGEADSRLPLISPHYGDLTGLPPLLIHVGEDEILLSDATRLAEKARDAGVDVQLEIWPGMWHVWHTFTPYLPEAQQAVEAIGNFIGKQVSPSPTALHQT
jgi:acetyl esterase/lipase